MATKEMDPQTEENGEGGNGGNSGSPKSKTGKWIGDYLKDPLADDVGAAASAEKVAELGFGEQKATGKLRICRLLDARSVHSEYERIQDFVTLTLSAHSGFMKANVATYLEKSGTLKTKLDASLAAVKAAKTQMKVVWDKACALDAARKDSCYSEAQSALEELPSTTDDGPEGLDRFNSEAIAIRDLAGELNDRSDDLFEKGIKYAGIQAFMNVASLEELAVQLETDVAELHKNVSDGIDTTSGEIETLLEEYEAGIATIGEKWYEYRSQQVAHAALSSLNSYLTDKKDYLEQMTALICEQEASPEELQAQLTTICEEVQRTFRASATCIDNTAGSTGKG